MDSILIQDLAIRCHVGVPKTERASPQLLLITIQLGIASRWAGAPDKLDSTVDYEAVCDRVAAYCKQGSWLLIETLAVQIADLLLDEFKPASASVEIKKFALPQTRHVAVRVTRRRKD